MKHRILALLLAAALLCAVLPAAAAVEPASGSFGEDLTWSLDADGVLTVSGSGAMPYEIFYPWYDVIDQITAVVIEPGVTSVSNSAFLNCTALRRVTLPEGLTRIDKYAFEGCVTLTEIALPDGLTTLGNAAFRDCKALAAVTLPASVTAVGESVFSGCTALAAIGVDAANATYSSDAAGVLYTKDKTRLLAAPGGLTGAYAIAGTATDIDSWAFSGCQRLTAVTVPQGVTALESYTFNECPVLTAASLPDGLTSIGDSAFYACAALQTIALPRSLTSLGESAFERCAALTELTLPEGLTRIGDWAFSECTALTGIAVPASVTEIGYAAFSFCPALRAITVAAENPSYSSDALGVLFDKEKTTLIAAPGCLHGNYDVPAGVTTIDYAAFAFCKELTMLTIPVSVTNILSEAFDYCDALRGIFVAEGNAYYSSDASGVLFNKTQTDLIRCPGGYLGDYTAPDTVTHVKAYAFDHCGRLTTVTLPASLESIGGYVFFCCDALKGVYLRGNAPFRLKRDTLFVTLDAETGEEQHLTGVSVYRLDGTTGWNVDWEGCPVVLWDGTPASTHVHHYEEKIQPATCLQGGSTGYACACGDGYVLGETAALGHDFRNGKCTRCGAADLNAAPTPMPSYTDFSDLLAEAWYRPGVTYALENGLMNGVGGGKFDPEGAVTRAMLVTTLYRAEQTPSTAGMSNPFADVPAGLWYTNTVIWAADCGIVNGTSATTFDPDAPITREQIATILYRRSKAAPVEQSLDTFPDAATASPYAIDALRWAVKTGLLNGQDGHLAPQQTAPRTQIATILMRYFAE